MSSTRLDRTDAGTTAPRRERERADGVGVAPPRFAEAGADGTHGEGGRSDGLAVSPTSPGALDDGAAWASEPPDHASEAGPERDWSAFLDGRARRLKRGRDYTGDPKLLVKRARDAAEALGKLVVDSRDSQGKYDYVWIQFVDGEVEKGRPCSRCGGTTLIKIQKHFLRCHTCASLLKATGDWDVEPGEYVAPAPPARTEAMSAPDADVDEHDGEEFAQILDARVLSRDGREITGPLVDEDFVLHFTFRFLRPVDYALPRVRFSVVGAGPSLRVQPPEPLAPSRADTVDARIRVPGNLFMPRAYSVELVLLLLPDRRRPTEYLRVTATDAAIFRVRKIGGRSILEAADGSDSPAPASPFAWDLEVRRDPTV